LLRKDIDPHRNNQVGACYIVSELRWWECATMRDLTGDFLHRS
jgi:hypothetical protein